MKKQDAPPQDIRVAAQIALARAMLRYHIAQSDLRGSKAAN